MIKLVQWEDSMVSPKDDRIMFDTGFNGVLSGCSITHMGLNTLHISDGYIRLLGGLIEVTGQNIEVETSASGQKLGQLWVRMNLDDNEPVQIMSEAASVLTPLTQNINANYDNGIYELQLATYNINETTISNLKTNMKVPLVKTEIADAETRAKQQAQTNLDNAMANFNGKYPTYTNRDLNTITHPGFYFCAVTVGGGEATAIATYHYPAGTEGYLIVYKNDNSPIVRQVFFVNDNTKTWYTRIINPTTQTYDSWRIAISTTTEDRTKGNENQPVYLNGGALTAGNAYIPAGGGTYYGNVTIDRNNGTTSAAGTSYLTLGNNLKAKTAGASRGRIAMYGTGGSGEAEFAATIQAGALTAARTFTLPDVTGTFAINQKNWTTTNKTTNFAGSWRYRKDNAYFDACFYGENSVKTTSAFGSLYYGTIKIDLPESMNVHNCVATVMNAGGAGCFMQLKTISATQLEFYVINAVSGTFTLGVSVRCLAS